MRTALVPAYHAGLRSRASEVRSQGRRVIQRFSRNKLIESKLLPRTSTFQPELHGGYAEIRKTLVRLKTMFSRALEKRVPYVEYADHPFFEIRNRQDFRINLRSLPQVIEGSSYDSIGNMNRAQREQACTNSAFVKPLGRYIRFLRFICLKHAIPLEISATYDLKFTSRQMRAIYDMTDRERSRLRNPEIEYVVTIDVSLVYWLNALFEDTLRTPNPPATLEDFLSRRVEQVGVANAYSTMDWYSSSIISPPLPDLASYYRRYWAPEKVFFFIPQIIQVLRTLTRKTHYVSSAFSIGAVEGS